MNTADRRLPAKVSKAIRRFRDAASEFWKTDDRPRAVWKEYREAQKYLRDSIREAISK